MARKGKTQVTYVIVAPPDLVAEGERLFRSHAPWMEKTHHHQGEKALLSYDVSEAPEKANPLDPASPATGNTCFILNEVYETDAGVADHFRQAQSSWHDFPALVSWMQKCKVAGVAAAPIVQSLW
jgi:hypothetical protein